MDNRVLSGEVVGADLNRGVHLRRGGSSDQYRDVHSALLHLLRHVDHLVKRRRDETREADDVDVVRNCGVEDLFACAHNSNVIDLVVVAAKHDSHNVLSDIVHVSLDGGHEDLSSVLGIVVGIDSIRILALGQEILPLLLLHERQQIRNGLFHHAGGLDDLGQEHLSGSEEISDNVHSVHQRAFDHVKGPLGRLAGLLDILLHKLRDSVNERVLEALRGVFVAPALLLDGFTLASSLPERDGCLLAHSHLEHLIGRFRVLVED
mmetsp:Transcript_26649/g.50508  ORF Transcript_26649/g.50508 Transcript_26649/m.50508 type:complete len:263 (+) Transcript_26649:1192-1980(+)